MAAAEDIGALVIRIEANLQNFAKGMQQFENRIENAGEKARGFSKTIQNAFSVFAGIGLFKAVDAIVGGLKSGVNMGLDFNKTMEQNKIAFESMLGSAEKADDLLSKLSTMAATTPFEFPELATASKKMLAFGFEVGKIPGMLKNIGNAAAGLGLGAAGVERIATALGQMMAKGKVSGEEMLQLTEAGIPAWDMLGKAMNKSTGELMKLAEKGVLPASAAVDALVRGMGERFPNMMEKQSKSFAGLMSTLRDNVQMTIGKVLEPAFTRMTDVVLPAIIEKTSLFQKKYEETGSVFSAFAAMFGADGDRISKIIEDIRIAFAKVGAFITRTIMPPVNDVVRFFGEQVIPLVGEHVKEWLPTISALFSDMWDAIKLIIDAMVTAFEFAWPLIKDVVLVAINTVGDIIGGLLRTLDGVIDFVVGIFTGDWKRAWSGVKDIFGGVWDAIGGILKGAINGIIAAVNFMIQSLNRIQVAIPDWVPGIGGKNFGISIPQIPQLAKGTSFVPFDTLAFLHKGEAVIPASKNPANPNATGAAFEIDYKRLGQEVATALRRSPIEVNSYIDGQRAAKAMWPRLVDEKLRLGVSTL